MVRQMIRRGISLPDLRDSYGRFVKGAAQTHGARQSKEYRCWISIKSRCLNPRNTGFKHYGARGIAICDRWLTFENFLEDMGRKPSPRNSIERKDVNGNYEPGNCLWATQTEQMRNTRYTHLVEFAGKRIPLVEAVETAPKGLKYNTVLYRIRRGWTIEQALNLAPQKGVKP